ncbi:WD repeat-containing protein 76-like [Daphnia carinata]|uniref:WD repeat-containing protein 76-like n=1 Tax=Daphnia carinata TaxID=120202 RepID=UPI00257E9CCD|nr:WD repeat-containing protein 76-like [Daphnia carinata]
MARRSARFAEKAAKSSPVKILDTPVKKKTTIKEYFKVPDPYVSIEKLDIESPQKKVFVKKELKREVEPFLDDSNESDDSEDSNYQDGISNTRKPNSKENKDQNRQTNTALSEYEKQIQQNIEERKKMFQELVGAAKNDFMNVISTESKEKKKAVQRGLKRKVEESIEVPPLRMSLRSRNPLKEEIISMKDEDERKPKAPKGGPFTLADAYLDQESIEDSKFIEEMIPLLEKEGELEKLPADQQDFLKLMKSFSIREEGIAKVTKARIYSMAWHPSNSKLLIAACDRDGNIGFWDVDKHEDKHQGVRAFKVHKQPVNCVTFDKFNPMRLLTTSYDGYVRCLDMHTNVFDEVYSIQRTKDTWTAYHAQKDPSTLIVSQSNGDVAVIDVRTRPGKAENIIHCFEMSARTVSLHPQDNNLFMTCNRYGELGIFDVRYTSKNEDELADSVISFPKAPKGVHGAFYSPITGQYALITCTDDTLKLYDVQKGRAEVECIKSISHNNFTGRWLTPFKAVWHPQRDDVFIVGSMEHPRRVELYGAPTGTLLHNFSGDFLGSVTSINAFHPTVPIFAGGNSSGRVHIFRS